MKIISGGVCAAKGFKASGVHCGIRKNRTKRDLALIYSEKVANAAAVYTTNLVKGAPLVVTKNHIADGKAQAVICNSGNANTCNANGVEIAEAHERPARVRARNKARRHRRRFDRRYRSAAEHHPDSLRHTRSESRTRRPLRPGGGGDNDDRHDSEGDCRQLRNRRS